MHVRRRLLAPLVLASLVVLPMAVAPAAGVPLCAPGAGTQTMTGQVAFEQAKSYLLLPFEVAQGTTRVEVGYAFTDGDGPVDAAVAQVPFQRSVLDLGLYDADGISGPDAFRGWGGSREGRLPARIHVQADSATRTFTPGPIEPGTWHVELGLAAVAPGGATWVVEVECHATPTGAPASPDPVDPAYVARDGAGWYHGDFHMHAFQSGGPGNEQVVAASRAAGLDFLPITEYVTTVHHDQWGAVQRANPDLLIWPGREVITYFGHANAIGETPSTVEYRHGFMGVTIADIQADTRADGALFQVNHPTLPTGPVVENICRGCGFGGTSQYTGLGDFVDLDAIDTFEVLSGPIATDHGYIGRPIPDLCDQGVPCPLPEVEALLDPDGRAIENPTTQTAIDLWERLLLEGHRITAVSGSDTRAVADYGITATAVHAESLSRPALIDGVRAGRAYVKAMGVHGSPDLELTASAGAEQVMIGGTLRAATATLHVALRGAAGQVLEVTRNGEVITTVPVTADDWTVDLPMVRGAVPSDLGSFYRVDVRDGLFRSIISNPIFLAE
jgi:hypothetical protein